MSFTPDQQDAIGARGGNLLLSAAAGSGKTTVLVERVLSLIKDGANVDQMLIVTFSRAAAADMKQKLTLALSSRAQAGDDICARQLEKAERASVSTIHSFCIDVLRTHFEAAGVDPGFRVMDDAEARGLEARALEDTLERALSEKGEWLSALEYGRDIKKLGALITGMYHFAQERPDPEGWLEEACVALPSGDSTVFADCLLAGARAQLGEARAHMLYALHVCALPLGPASYGAHLQGELDWLESVLPLPYAAARDALVSASFKNLPPIRLKDGADADEREKAKTLVKDRRDAFKKLVKRAGEQLPDLDAAREDMRASLGALQVLRGLTLDFEAALDLYKADRSALTFGDLEHKALRALSDGDVSELVRARYTHVFVDEYQDVSDLQEALIVKVARAGNLFMVGDVKQSIYRFRQAEPTLFIEKYHRYGRQEGGRLIALKQNFRSRASILQLVNRIFERAMSGENAEVSYDEAARLCPGAAFEDGDPPIELHLIAPDAGEDEETQDEEAEELNQAQREGALVAGRIAELLNENFYDPRERRTRRVEPRDIAVIARVNSCLGACEKVLRARGVQVYVDRDGGYLGALEVRIMLALLEVIENRRRDYPLLAVLRSPIVGLTTTELARVRAAFPEGSYRDAMTEYLKRDDGTARKLTAFEDNLDHWRFLSRALPLSQFVDLLLRETGFYNYAGGMPMGLGRQGNLDLLCYYASRFDEDQPGGLTGFLSYVREVESTGGDMGAAHTLGAGDDVVVMMTAHKSKGLEYPFVFVVGLGRAFRTRRAEGELLTHRTLGAGLYVNDPALGTRREMIARRAIAAARERESLEEEKRVLYVALTRAKHQLILVGSERFREKAETRWAVGRLAATEPRNFLDMIVPALPDRGQSPEVTLRWHGEVQEKRERTERVEEKIDPAQVERARAALTWRYPHAEEAFLPVKLTVSGLTRTLEGAHVAPVLSRRPRFMSGEKTTGAERGTATHAALGALELGALAGLTGAALREELARQLDGFARRGITGEPVPPERLARFFEREAGKRLLKAETLHREWPFNLRMTAREALGIDADTPLMVQGVIDCCFVEDGQWVLMDYKTDALKDEEALVKRYRAQLAMYREALWRITGIPVKETLLCLLAAGKEVAL